MTPSPSNNVKVQLSGLLKSSHALLGLLGIIAAVMFSCSLAAHFAFGEYLFAIFFVVLLSSVLIRYLIKGPESERLQPSVSLIHQENRMDAQFVNFDFQQHMTPQMVGIFRRFLARPTTVETKALQQDTSHLLPPLSPPAGGQSATDKSVRS